jgi:hypothetical protein
VVAQSPPIVATGLQERSDVKAAGFVALNVLDRSLEPKRPRLSLRGALLASDRPQP